MNMIVGDMWQKLDFATIMIDKSVWVKIHSIILLLEIMNINLIPSLS